MRVLVTGGTGFVGSHLVDRLLARGDRVVCLVRDARRAARQFGPGPGPQLVEGTLDDAPALRAASRDVEAVIHAAGATGAARAGAFFRVNAEGTRHLVRAVADANPSLARLVYVSSLAAAGPSLPGRPRDEHEAPAPVSAYGRSKLAGETAVREAPFPWTIIRPPAIYGPRDREFLRLFRVLRWHVAPLLVHPDQELSFIYIDDLVEALLAAMAPPAAGSVYFAAHTDIVTAEEFVHAAHDAMLGTLDEPPERALHVLTIPRSLTRLLLFAAGGWATVTGRATLLSPDKGREFSAPAWTCTSAAFERDTGWRARTGLAEGLRETVTWYRDRRWL